VTENNIYVINVQILNHAESHYLILPITHALISNKVQ